MHLVWILHFWDCVILQALHLLNTWNETLLYTKGVKMHKQHSHIIQNGWVTERKIYIQYFSQFQGKWMHKTWKWPIYLNWIKSIYVIEFIFCCRWFRVEGVGLRQVLPTPKIKYHLEVLILQELTVEDSGVYVCIVNNTVGSERVEVNLTVRSPLGVNVEPATQVIDLNRQAVFTCSVVGWPVESTSWYKNGYPLHVSHR